MQYTIRGISPEIDAALRARAAQDDKSLNETALKALAEGVGLTGTQRKRRDLSDIATGEEMEKEVLDALASFDKIDEEMWR
jgi:plasmid stability protein